MDTRNKSKDNKDYLDDTVTKRELRRNLKNWTIVIAFSFLLLAGGLFWALQAVVNKSTGDIVDNAVSICERGIPVRVATNKNSAATRLVSLNTANFLEGIARLPTTPADRKKVLYQLADNYKDVAKTTPQVPIVDCNTEYRNTLE